MARSGNNLKAADDVLALLEEKAASEGRNVDDLASDILREALREKSKSWQALLKRGQEHGRRSGISEDQVPNIVREWRNEHRGRS